MRTNIELCGFHGFGGHPQDGSVQQRPGTEDGPGPSFDRQSRDARQQGGGRSVNHWSQQDHQDKRVKSSHPLGSRDRAISGIQENGVPKPTSPIDLDLIATGIPVKRPSLAPGVSPGRKSIHKNQARPGGQFEPLTLLEPRPGKRLDHVGKANQQRPLPHRGMEILSTSLDRCIPVNLGRRRRSQKAPRSRTDFHLHGCLVSPDESSSQSTQKGPNRRPPRAGCQKTNRCCGTGR